MHVFTILPSITRGGLERVFIHYLRMLNELGYVVTAVLHPKSPLISEAKPYVSSLILSHYSTQRYAHLNVRACLWLYQVMRRTKPQVILLHNAKNLRYVRHMRPKNCPIIIVNHGTKLKRLQKSDHVIAITESMAHALNPVLPSVHLIRNSLPVYLKKPLLKPISEPIKIGFLGRFTQEKGLPFLLKALTILKDKKISFKLYVAGDGDRRVLEHHALHGSIIHLGWIEDVYAFLQSMDMLAIPSRYESFGMSAIEAMHAGCPVVACNCNGLMDVVIDNITGLIVDRDKPNDMADAMLRIIKDQSLRYKIIHEGYKRVKQYYSLESTKYELEKILTHEL